MSQWVSWPTPLYLDNSTLLLPCDHIFWNPPHNFWQNVKSRNTLDEWKASIYWNSIGTGTATSALTGTGLSSANGLTLGAGANAGPDSWTGVNFWTDSWIRANSGLVWTGADSRLAWTGADSDVAWTQGSQEEWAAFQGSAELESKENVLKKLATMHIPRHPTK